MGQGEVLKVLEEKGSLTEKEIAEILDITISSVWNCLRRLRRSGEVERIAKIFNEDGKKLGVRCYLFAIKQENKK